MSDIAIRFPLFHAPEISVEFFPDELPEDHYDLIDGLRLELAPLKVWKQCAVEYYRQGSIKGFDDILGDIVNELKNPEVAAAYKAKENYSDGTFEIYIVLAAKEIVELAKKKVTSSPNDDIAAIKKRCVDSLKTVEAEKPLHEYVWILKGFYELFTGGTRAQEYFKMVLERVTKGQSFQKKCLFPTLIGLGMVAYSQNNFQSALDNFCRAVNTHPDCDASVRTAIACCAFKLQQYDRSRLALQRASAIDAGDVNQLVLHALLELADAKKDRIQRVTLRQKAHEYLYLANKIDNSNPSTLVLLANHDFHSWRVVALEPKGYLLSAEKILVPFSGYSEVFEMGNQIKLKLSDSSPSSTHLILNRREVQTQDYPSLVEHLPPNTSYYEIKFSHPLRPSAYYEYPISVSHLDVKNLKAVVDAAAAALSFTNLPALKAECHYILGKVQHLHGNLAPAFDLYSKALQYASDFAPAAFGAAQIYFARQDYDNALKLFDSLLKGNQDDKDTLAYVKLLQGIINNEIAHMDKLREIAPGFQFEIDLWLSQAQLRHKKNNLTNSDLTDSLKCYLYAKECFELQQIPIPATVLGNIANLYFLIGNHERALDYLRQTLREFRSSSVEGSSNGMDEPSIYSCSDFENFYYQWKDKAVCELIQDRQNLSRFSLPSDDGAINLQNIFHVGEEVLIKDMLWIVESIPSSSSLICRTYYGNVYQYQPFQQLMEMKKQFEQEKERNKSFQLPSISEMMEILASENSHSLLVVRQKEKWNNFSDQTLMYSYNLARIFEDMGNVQPAMIIYRKILQLHPAHVDSYIRLSRVLRGLGKMAEAIEYLLNAKSIAPESVDIKVTLGDYYFSAGLLEEAKKLFDDAYLGNKRDPQALLAMGNYWLNIYQLPKKSDETHLKTSYKFYHPILSEHVRNAYAANGLGIVCASKGENDAAREIFSKIRQSNMKNTEDTDINLANVYMSERRYVEAERLYYSVIKNITGNTSFQHHHYSHFFTLIGIAQYSTQKFEESFKTLLKAWHMTPMEPNILFNFSIISNQIANMCIDRQQKTSEEIGIIMNIVKVSIKILHYLAKTKKHIGQFESKELTAKEQTAMERLRVLTEQFTVVSETERQQREARRKIDEEHQLRKQQRFELEQQKVEAEITKRQENIDRVLQQERRLEELRSKWIVMTSSSRKDRDDDMNEDADLGEEGGGKKKRKRNQNNNTLEPTEKPKRKKKVKKLKSANLDSDEEGPGRRRKSQPQDSDESDNENNDQDSTNSWLEDLDKPLPASGSLLSSQFGGTNLNDSDDDIFGDNDEDKDKSAQPAVGTNTSNKVNLNDDEEDDDFNFE